MISRVAPGKCAPNGHTAPSTALPAVSLTAVTAAPVAADDNAPAWSMSGQGITNWRFQPDEKKLTSRNVGSLRTAWVATLAGDISATPAVVDGAVYVPDWGG